MIEIKTIQDNEDIKVFLEYVDDKVVYGHLSLQSWGRHILRKLDKLLITVGKQLKQEGYEYLYAYNKEEDEKWFKFMTLLGFEFAFIHDGYSFFVYKIGEYNGI